MRKHPGAWSELQGNPNDMKLSTSWDRSARTCQNCQLSYLPKTIWQKTCSYKCGYEMQNRKNKRGITNLGKCARCGAGLEHKKSHAIYCSKLCKSLDHNFKHKRNTRPANTARRREIWERDGQTCYICQKAVSLKEYELDHLLPLSRGGDSSIENLATACRFCNRSRGNTIGVIQLMKLAELRK